MPVSFVKYYSFTEALAEKIHNLGSDQLRVALTNTTPNLSHTQLSSVAEIGYTSLINNPTCRNITTNSSTQTSGVYKLVLNDLPMSSSGNVGPFRWVILYNDTATNDELIGYYDRGYEAYLTSGSTLLLDFDGTNGAITIT